MSADLRYLLEQAAPHVCSLLCPSVKYDDKPWQHVELCQAITKALGLRVREAQEPELQDR